MNLAINQTRKQWEQTVVLYLQIPHALSNCQCAYCRNYIANLADFPAWTKDLQAQFGIELSKAAEIFEVEKTEEGHRYFALYHLIGTIQKAGTEPSVVERENGKVFLQSNEMDFVPESFPVETLQLTVELTLPWLVEPLEEDA